MIAPFDYFEHRWACKQKQIERSDRIANLPPEYHSPVSSQDRRILDKSVEQLVQDVHNQTIKPIDILRSYGKVAIKAHAKTNCLTEVMINPGAEKWIEDVNLKGPLAGIPVSLKDSITVGGFDVSVGYSKYTGKPHARDGTIEQSPMSKPTYPSPSSPSNPQMLSGAAPQTPTTLLTPPVALPVANPPS
ncbi:MAG: hypothetical protein Q9212_006288 [Teloschistes hypoglaucus]